MAIIKCKMCGGDLNLIEGASIAECEFCGSVQTIPNLDNEKKLVQFERAERLRKQCEFDKAAGIYETIVADFRQEAEAYWGLVLCKYGIEYIDDPATGKKIPTCHRSSFDSIMEDGDFEQALENADPAARKVYREEAKAIEGIRKGIIAVSANEEPYDIFICYKETAENGDRTLDSVLAQDVYDALTDKGYRVFFSRITLEDKLGVEYEPYIFAALNSAKIMLAFGTDYEYFNAVWVKNEWSRFLKLMAKDKEKHLIPCYKGIDAYDMPKEFAKLQAQDLGKVGAVQDLLRGIEKLLPKSEPVKETIVVQQAASQSNPTVESYLKRAFMFLEDGDWNGANEYCEKVLDINPENAQAYLGKLMAELKVKKQEELKNCAEPFDGKNNYQKVLRFAHDGLKATLTGYIEFIKERNENARLEEIYSRARNIMSRANNKSAYDEAAMLFETIPQYKDSSILAQECREKAERARLEGMYTRATSAMQAANTEIAYNEAAHLFEIILQYKDASVLAQECREKAEIARLEGMYTRATSTMQAAKTESAYKEAASLFASIPQYKDASTLTQECKEKAESARKDAIYWDAIDLVDRRVHTIEMLEKAINLLQTIPGWKDADEQTAICKKKIEEIKVREESARLERERRAEIARQEALQRAKQNKTIAIIAFALFCVVIAFIIISSTIIVPNSNYNDALALMEAGNYMDAISAFEALDGHKDSEEKIQQCRAGQYNKATALMDAGQYSAAIAAFGEIDDYNDSEDLIVACKYEQALILVKEEQYAEAISAFAALGDYKDSANQIKNCKYEQATSLKTQGNTMDAIKAFLALENYKDSSQQCFDLWGYITPRKTIATSGSGHTVGLKTDGTVVAVGNNSSGQCNVSNWKNIAAISAGIGFTVGLRTNGTVVATGANGYGECNVHNWSNIVAISAGDDHTVGLKADGTVVAVGNNDNGRCDVSKWRNIIAISAGPNYTVGLRADGTVVTAGVIRKYSSVSFYTSSWTDIVAISAGVHHIVGIKADGTVIITWDSGSGTYVIEGWKNIITVAADYDHTTGVRADGTIALDLRSDYHPEMRRTIVWNNIVDISVRYSCAIGLRADGTVVAVGDNRNGACDVSDWKDIKLPNQRG